MARRSVVGVRVEDTWGLLPSAGLVSRSKGAGHRRLGHTGLGRWRPAGEPTCWTEKAPPCPWDGEPGFLLLPRWPWLNHLPFLDLSLLPAEWNDSCGAGLVRGLAGWPPCAQGSPVCAGSPPYTGLPLQTPQCAVAQAHTRKPLPFPLPWDPCWKTGRPASPGQAGPGAMSAGNASL